jgi:hypothetical protein
MRFIYPLVYLILSGALNSASMSSCVHGSFSGEVNTPSLPPKTKPISGNLPLILHAAMAVGVKNCLWVIRDV